MRRALSLALVTSVLFALSGCDCAGSAGACTTDAECGPGALCVAGTWETGGVFAGCDPNKPKNAQLDTDCDGLNDEEEYKTLLAGNRKTDPCRADTDRDGVKDGVELGRTTSVNTTCGFSGDLESYSRT